MCLTKHTCGGRLATAARWTSSRSTLLKRCSIPVGSWRDPKSRTGEAIRVVGYSAGMDRVLVVMLVPDGHPPDGLWHVATAWPADSHMRRVYDGKVSEDG